MYICISSAAGFIDRTQLPGELREFDEETGELAVCNAKIGFTI